MKRIFEYYKIAATLLITVGLLAISVASVNANDVQTDGKSIEEFVNPDGRLDLEEARQSGYEGSIDLSGFDVTIDPNTQEPVIRTSDDTHLLNAEEANINYVSGTIWSGMRSVDVAGTYAYCLSTFGLQIFDISDLTSPSEVSKMFITEATSGEMAVQGNYVYITIRSGSLVASC